MTGKVRTWFERKSEGDLRALLPWYLNGSLSPAERQAVETWLRDDVEARAELAAWQQMQAAVAQQPPHSPSSQVHQRLRAEVHARRAARRPAFAWPQLAWGAALTLAVLALLWITVQPGVVVQWSVADGRPAAFRVYRAPVGSADFGLLGELPAGAEVQTYRYVDTRLLPGQSYVYRVEAVGQGGQVSASQAVTAGGLEALPGQLAVLVTSLIVGGGAVTLAQYWRPGSRARWGVGGLTL